MSDRIEAAYEAAGFAIRRMRGHGPHDFCGECASDGRHAVDAFLAALGTCVICEGNGERADVYNEEGDFDVVRCLTCNGAGKVPVVIHDGKVVEAEVVVADTLLRLRPSGTYVVARLDDGVPEHEHGVVQQHCEWCGDLRDELDFETRRELGLDDEG